MTHPTPYPDVNGVLPSHPYLAITLTWWRPHGLESASSLSQVVRR